MCTSSSLSFGVALPAVNSVIFRHLDHARLGVDHITIFQQFEMLSMAGVGWEKVEIAETYTHTPIYCLYIYIYNVHNVLVTLYNDIELSFGASIQCT